MSAMAARCFSGSVSGRRSARSVKKGMTDHGWSATSFAVAVSHIRCSARPAATSCSGVASFGMESAARCDDAARPSSVIVRTRFLDTIKATKSL